MTADDLLRQMQSQIAAYFAGTGNPAPAPIITIPAPPPPPPLSSDVKDVGDMSAQGGPRENGLPDMQPNVTYARRQSLDGRSAGGMQFLCGNLTGYDLPNFETWVSAVPGGPPLTFTGCERVEYFGSNVSVNLINVGQLVAAGVREVWFNVRAKAFTGRFMQRIP